MSSVSNAASRPSSTFGFLTRSGPTGLVLWTIAFGTVLRVLLDRAVGYGTGEGYYVATARHLALSYFDQPPLSLWLTWVMIQIGDAASTFATRSPFMAMFALATWLMYRLTARLFDEWAGAWAAVLFNLPLVFTVSVGSWVQPDGPLFLFLLAATIPVVELCFGRPSRPMLVWVVAGAGFGFALLSKYHAILTLGGLLIFVATTPGFRARFFQRGLLVAGLVAAAVFAPVLVWNWQNDWVSFLFQGGRAAGGEIRVDWLLRSIAGQAFLIGILVWPPLIWVLLKGLRNGPKEPKVWFLCCLAIVPIVLFTIVALWAPLGLHFHWQAPGYMFLFPILGKAVANRLDRGDRFTRRWLATSAAFTILLVAVFGSQVRLGWLYSVWPGSKAEKGPIASMMAENIPWSALRDVLVKQGQIPRQRLFAVVPSWIHVGKVDVEIGDDMPVICLSLDPRNIAFGWDESTFRGWDALIFITGDDEPTWRYGLYFRDISPLTQFDVSHAGAVVMTVRVYYARDYHRRFPLPLPLRRAATE